MRSYYLVKRGPRPSHHTAPFHPVIVCDRRPTAMWQADWTGDRSWVWVCEARGGAPSGGLLLLKAAGLDVNYGHIVRGGEIMVDGELAVMGFHHPHSRPDTWALLREATWWSPRPLPVGLSDLGVKLADDDFTQRTIRTDDRNVAERRGYGWL